MMRNLRIQGIDRRSGFQRDIAQLLEPIQEKWIAERPRWVVAINTTTGEYEMAEEYRDAISAFRKRWPNCGWYSCRVDGSPALRI